MAILAQLIDRLAGVAFSADVLKVTFYFEMFRDSTVFLDGIWINGGTCKLVYVVLNERGVKGESADHLSFGRTSTFMHEPEVDVSTE